MNWNILVAEGKESKRDSLSSGERKGNSLNQFFGTGVVGKQANKVIPKYFPNFVWGVESTLFLKTFNFILDEAAESCTIDGESPVVKSSF